MSEIDRLFQEGQVRINQFIDERCAELDKKLSTQINILSITTSYWIDYPISAKKRISFQEWWGSVLQRHRNQTDQNKHRQQGDSPYYRYLGDDTHQILIQELPFPQSNWKNEQLIHANHIDEMLRGGFDNDIKGHIEE